MKLKEKLHIIESRLWKLHKLSIPIYAADASTETGKLKLNILLQIKSYSSGEKGNKFTEDHALHQLLSRKLYFPKKKAREPSRKKL